MMRGNIILIGGGGHCHSCIDTIEQQGKFTISGVIDLAERIGQRVLGYDIIGSDDDIARLLSKGYSFLISIGQIKISKRRKELFDELTKAGAYLPTIISPRSYVSPHAKIGFGTIIMPGAVVNAQASIGQNCIINTLALIEHDVNIADNCHISTGAIVNGDTHLGPESFVGSKAMIREGLNIGSQVIIGAGTSIFKDVPNKTILKA